VIGDDHGSLFTDVSAELVDGPNYGESFPFGCGIVPFWSVE
jgi:hypothetical protein